MASRVPQRGAARVSLPRTSAPKDTSADGTRPSTAAFSVRTDSDRVIHVYAPDRTSSGGSASVRSPASSGGSRSFSSEESWSEIDEDDIEPSDSASRSRNPSRRHQVEARPAPTRRHSSRRIVERDDLEPRRRHSSRRQPSRHESRHESRHDSRHGRSSSRRVHSDESSGTGTSADDYPPYGDSRMPHAPYPGRSGYRHVPAGQPHGYPPSMAGGGPGAYPDPHAGYDQRTALMSMRPDPFGYPAHSNPFSPQSQQQNPFSPIGDERSNYFAEGSMAPPPPRRHYSEDHRRPQSFGAPPSHYGSEMMAPYQPHPGWGMPGYPPYPPRQGWPPSAASSPSPKEEKSAELEALKKLLEKRNDDDTKEKSTKESEIEKLKDLIKRHEEERVAREKAWIAEREAEAAAKAAEKAKAEEEKKRKEEIEAARKKAKEDAEDKAKKEAEKAKAEHEKKLAEAEKAKADSEAAKKALEDEIAKNKPTPDSLKAPIRFKDAVGRKFSFPWHICKSWKGMEGLIKQAFLHVDMIGEHVHQGHYDLTGPDGEIILPQVWDTMVQPDWEITMHLWPMEEEKKPPKEDPANIIDPFANLGVGGPMDRMPFDMMMPDPGKPKKGGKGKDGKKKKSNSPEIINVGPHGMQPPQGFGDPFAGLPGFGGPMPMPMGDQPKKDKVRPKSKSIKSKEISPFAAWLAGGAISNSKPKKR